MDVTVRETLFVRPLHGATPRSIPPDVCPRPQIAFLVKREKWNDIQSSRVGLEVETDVNSSNAPRSYSPLPRTPGNNNQYLGAE